MPSAIVLYFDEDSERAIQDLWDALDKEGIPLDHSAGIRPHITLGIFDELSCEPCGEELSEFAKQAGNLSLSLSYFGFFHEPEVVLFLAPTPADILLDFHARMHTTLADLSKNPWELYQPGKWVPHCTLALGLKPDQFNTAVSVCSRLKLPIRVKTTQIGVVEFQPMNGVFK